MQIKIAQEIPCQYLIEVFQEYQNPIKVTLVSPLGSMADCDYNEKRSNTVSSVVS